MLQLFGLFQPKKCYNIFLGWKRLTLSSHQKFQHMKNRIKPMMPNGVTGLERVKKDSVEIRYLTALSRNLRH
jgi:hypothetical protein